MNNTIPFTPPAPPPPAPLTPDDPRLTALAIGEIVNPALADALLSEVGRDPALRRAFDERTVLAKSLTAALRPEVAGNRAPRSEALAVSAAIRERADAELAASAATAAGTDSPAPPRQPPPPPSRFFAGGANFDERAEQQRTTLSNIVNFIFWGGLAAAAAAAIYVSIPTAPDGDAPAKHGSQTETARKTAQGDGHVRLQPAPAKNSNSTAGSTGTAGSSQTTAGKPPTGAVKTAPADNSPSDEFSLSAWCARQPSRTRGAENPFIAIAPRRQRVTSSLDGAGAGESVERLRHAAAAPLIFNSAGQDYLRKLRSVFAKGRLPERRDVRLDALVNAFAAERTAAGAAAGALSASIETVPAPWMPAHLLVRVTIDAPTGAGDEPFATNVVGSLAFNDGAVAAWRLLGAEDGGAGAPGIELPATLRPGESFTTLFEIRTQSRAGNEAPPNLGTLVLHCTDRLGSPFATRLFVPPPRTGGIAAASEETRLAAAVATLGLALRHSAYAGNATPELAATLAATLPPANKQTFVAFLNDATEALRHKN